jgi:fructose-specific phosphotransferase system component IIB
VDVDVRRVVRDGAVTRRGSVGSRSRNEANDIGDAKVVVIVGSVRGINHSEEIGEAEVVVIPLLVPLHAPLHDSHKIRQTKVVVVVDGGGGT